MKLVLMNRGETFFAALLVATAIGAAWTGHITTEETTMKQDAALVSLVIGAVIAVISVALFNYWLGRESLRPERDALRRERDALRAQVAVLRAVDGDGSCAVQANGPRVLCALLGGRLQRQVLADGDAVCAVKDRWSGRVTCRLADGREITLRRAR